MSEAAVHRKLRFGPFELSIGERVLRRGGQVLPLGGRALDILIYLAERQGEVIAKQELMDRVWPDVTVEEINIRVHVAAIRKTLADGQFGNRYIANIKARGYSFVGSVVSLAANTESGSETFRHQGRFPVRPLVMIGREAVISKVRGTLQDERFVTLLGPGGIGKTSIALAVGRAAAEEFGGEVYFVDLEGLTDPRHVVVAVATSLGLALKSEDAILELVDLVRSRKLLIILDSCEHVIEAVASVAEQLYQETEQVHLLATSRECLKVEGERCYRVGVLESPPDGSAQTAKVVLQYAAARLFVQRVSARDGAFVLTDESAPFVADICRKLDGLPLAIELAAGQVAALGIKGTAARLLSRLELLRLSRRTTVPRHRTLKATLDWSYNLLSDLERIVFRRIAFFVGDFTLEGVQRVASEPGSGASDIVDAMAGLSEKSLLETRLDHGQARYRLLHTTRAYALGKLEEHDELEPISARHAECVAEQLESEKTTVFALPKTERVLIYAGQLGNVRVALECSFGPRGDDEVSTRLAAASMPLFIELSLLIECRAWAERAIARLGDRHKNSRRAMEIYESPSLLLTHSEESSERIREAFTQALDVTATQRESA
jgi:predicted ATPase/DNA-binding winged helix-turn-helix (wHTH) protein